MRVRLRARAGMIWYGKHDLVRAAARRLPGCAEEAVLYRTMRAGGRRITAEQMVGNRLT